MKALKTQVKSQTELQSGSDQVRVHAYLAGIGLGSRREIEKKIREGRIIINGRVARIGEKLDPFKDRVRVDGKNLPQALTTEAILVCVYKPRGVVTTLKDPEGRPTVRDLLPKNLGRLFPVGRLDVMSEGLVLMTNDGDLAHRIMHPTFEVPKVYEVKIRGLLDEKKREYLEKGVRIGGEKWSGAEILNFYEATEEGVPKYKVTVKVYEGKNHHVRRLFEALKCRVIRLKRLAIGPLQLKGLARSGYRILSPAQLRRLRKDLGLVA